MFIRNAVHNGKTVTITISTTTDGYESAIGAFGQKLKDRAGDKVTEAVKAGTAFRDANFNKMAEVKKSTL
ncbi:hypothetical protein VE03_08517 [Pseudogymnoascus sp. 23342-1-I1]|nr:hypothetical protein VE03_08517 [Pseudogymnoascus sp. 23342-1-I1]